MLCQAPGCGSVPATPQAIASSYPAWLSTMLPHLINLSIVAFQYSEGTYKKDGASLLSNAHCDKARRDGFKLKEGQFTLDIRKTFFTLAQVAQLKVPCLETLKGKLDRALSSLI